MGMLIVPWLAALAAGAGCGGSNGGRDGGGDGGGGSGGGDAATGVGSCELLANPSDGGAWIYVCSETAGLSQTGLDDLRQACMDTGLPADDAGVSWNGQFIAGPCPRAGSVGGCNLPSAMSVTDWYYSDSGATAASAQSSCAARGGTYVSP